MIFEEDLSLCETAAGWESTHFEACTGGDLVRIQQQQARKFENGWVKGALKSMPLDQDFWGELDAMAVSGMDATLIGKS